MEATLGLPPAVVRALPLLEPGLRDAEPKLRDGYLDLVGDGSPRSTGPAQDLMLTGIVPAIYERWWRPVLGRAAKGIFGPGMAEERRIARLLLGLSPGDGVLDVACGPGNFSREFARAVGSTGLAVGIDASPTMLARAVRDTGSVDVAYVRGDAVALPFRDDSFDAVCCFAALHLFAEPFTALDHMTRVLTSRPGRPGRGARRDADVRPRGDHRRSARAWLPRGPPPDHRAHPVRRRPARLARHRVGPVCVGCVAVRAGGRGSGQHRPRGQPRHAGLVEALDPFDVA